MEKIVLERFKIESDLTRVWYRIWKERGRDMDYNMWKEHLLKKETLYNVLREAGYTAEELMKIELS